MIAATVLYIYPWHSIDVYMALDLECAMHLAAFPPDFAAGTG